MISNNISESITARSDSDILHPMEDVFPVFKI